MALQFVATLWGARNAQVEWGATAMVAADLIPWIDMIGYFGGGVTLWGMYSRTMIPLRWGAVGGNVGFLVFGLLASSYPTLVARQSG